MDVTHTFEPHTRAAWRGWLAAHHRASREVWMLYRTGPDVPPSAITYLDAVEEALCFGWVDGIAKRHGENTAQRFTPRRAKSSWTELNKERARRLIAAGLMTEAGRQILPDLDPATFTIPPEIEAALRADEGVWRNFQAFPPLYQRVRVGVVREMLGKNRAEYERRLATLLENTRKNKMYGNWDDSRLKRSVPAGADR